MSFMKIVSIRANGFHRHAQLFELNFFTEKNFLYTVKQGRRKIVTSCQFAGALNEIPVLTFHVDTTLLCIILNKVTAVFFLFWVSWSLNHLKSSSLLKALSGCTNTVKISIGPGCQEQAALFNSQDISFGSSINLSIMLLLERLFNDDICTTVC